MRLRLVGRVSLRTRHCPVTEDERTTLTPTRNNNENAGHRYNLL